MQYTCYSWSNIGHMARFCPNQGQGHEARGSGKNTIFFPSDNGSQRLIWVDYPSNRLALGYYPVEPVQQGEVVGSSGRRTSGQGTRFSQAAAPKDANPNRITKIKDVAYVDIMSSAANKMTIGNDEVHYVNAVEDVYGATCYLCGDLDAG